jgi:hypothetical protein
MPPYTSGRHKLETLFRTSASCTSSDCSLKPPCRLLGRLAGSSRPTPDVKEHASRAATRCQSDSCVCRDNWRGVPGWIIAVARLAAERRATRPRSIRSGGWLDRRTDRAGRRPRDAASRGTQAASGPRVGTSPARGGAGPLAGTTSRRRRVVLLRERSDPEDRARPAGVNLTAAEAPDHSRRPPVRLKCPPLEGSSPRWAYSSDAYRT